MAAQQLHVETGHAVSGSTSGTQKLVGVFFSYSGFTISMLGSLFFGEVCGYKKPETCFNHPQYIPLMDDAW